LVRIEHLLQRKTLNGRASQADETGARERLKTSRINAEKVQRRYREVKGSTFYCTAFLQPTLCLPGIYDYFAKSFHLMQQFRIFCRASAGRQRFAACC
jgi:hypothetical protein